mmetsp:Transcript_16168/g.34244  ORF Transcript_16168/g.34244 Transcript_16168/m.34244 type:complete len:101 (+) Transcript_16168:191-493(+)
MHEAAHHFMVPAFDRMFQCGAAQRIHCVPVSTVTQQAAHHIQVTAYACKMQRRSAHVVNFVYVVTSLHQLNHNIRPTSETASAMAASRLSGPGCLSWHLL